MQLYVWYQWLHSSLNSPRSLRLPKTLSETPQSFDCLRIMLKTHSLGDCSETSSLLGVYCSLETGSLWQSLRLTDFLQSLGVFETVHLAWVTETGVKIKDVCSHIVTVWCHDVWWQLCGIRLSLTLQLVLGGTSGYKRPWTANLKQTGRHFAGHRSISPRSWYSAWQLLVTTSACTKLKYLDTIRTEACLLAYTQSTHPYFSHHSSRLCPRLLVLKTQERRQKDWCLEDVLQAQSLLLILV